MDEKMITNYSLKLATVRIFVIASDAIFIPIPAASFSDVSDFERFLFNKNQSRILHATH